MKPVVIVSGAIANKYRNGGEAWVRLSWAAGLRRLGFDVYLVEQINAAACTDATGCPAPLEESVQAAYFRDVTEQAGFGGHSALVAADGGDATPRTSGISWAALLDVAASAELLVNISGHLTLEPLVRAPRRRAYIDIDPGFTQFWHADPALPFRVGGHDFYFTVAENIGAADCPIPTADIPWRPIRQPVVMNDWPAISGRPNCFTTIASWRGPFGVVEFGGRTYRLKLHEFRKVIELPTRVRTDAATPADAAFELALDIHPADARDRAALEQNGWRIVDPKAIAADPQAFRRYVQDSAAEFSVAQGIYVDTNSGWFSDRTVRYLASGKPAVVQETGFSRNIKSGVGLVPFDSLDSAAEGARRIMSDYATHSAAARALAAEYFDSDKVLPRMLHEVGVS